MALVEIEESLKRINQKIKVIAQRYKKTKEDHDMLSTSIDTMEADHKKAMKINTTFEAMLKERERLKERLHELLEKVEKAHL
ncbi:hypothetical protein ACFL6Y_00420 [Elusimicrobiota bacterium]